MTEPSTLKRTALVYGGSAGIGFAVAERLAADHRVVIAGRHADSLEKAAGQLRERTGSEIGTLVSDIAAPDDVTLDAMSSLKVGAAAYGPPAVLVLNAGGPPPGRILDVTDDAWQAGAGLLLLGPLRLARRALPDMAARGFGRLVFVTSGQVRQPQPDLAVSVVLRSAVTAAAKLLSREYAAHGVTVNCVAPGATDTQRRRDILTSRAGRTGTPLAELEAADVAAVPAGRPGTADEIAAAVAFLASDGASYDNGTVLTVDGGRTETF
jgi:3-oxoacyl-[acyl-carrier protein] reductase